MLRCLKGYDQYAETVAARRAMSWQHSCRFCGFGVEGDAVNTVEAFKRTEDYFSVLGSMGAESREDELKVDCFKSYIIFGQYSAFLWFSITDCLLKC